MNKSNLCLDIGAETGVCECMGFEQSGIYIVACAREMCKIS